MKHLFLTIALLPAACGGSWAKSIKNKHVILIGLDGWEALQRARGTLTLLPRHQTEAGRKKR